MPEHNLSTHFYYCLTPAIYHHQELLHNALQWIQSLGWVRNVAFILLYIIATILLVPGSILTLGAGILFGVFWGSVYVLIAAFIGETAAFLLGRSIARDWISHKIDNNQVFLALNQALNREGLKIIILTRLSPIFPFSLLNYAFGVTGISLRDYFLGSVGMIPMTITYVYLGSLAEDLTKINSISQLANSELIWTIKICGLVVTVVATFFITRIARQALNKAIKESVI
ncbi:MAG: TVP38/TMEM64 family protein [Cyanobacteria bacterium P01_A01_bin.83]